MKNARNALGHNIKCFAALLCAIRFLSPLMEGGISRKQEGLPQGSPSYAHCVGLWLGYGQMLMLSVPLHEPVKLEPPPPLGPPTK